MKLFLDECVDRRLALPIVGHDVKTSRQMGWTGVNNDELLKRVAAEEFDAFITMDRNLAFQQNVAAQPFAVLVLRAKTNRLSDQSGLVPKLLAALPTTSAGEVISIGQN